MSAFDDLIRASKLALEQPYEPDPAYIPCVTLDTTEGPLRHRYIDGCVGLAELVAASIHCPDDKCGGHPICRPCYDRAKREGLVL